MIKLRNNVNAIALRKKFNSNPKDLVHIVDNKSNPYTTMAPAWTSNENSGYIRQILKTSDIVLSVASTLDNVIDMSLYGIRNIYAVDINPSQLPVSWLKYASVVYLKEYSEFYDFVVSTSDNTLSKKIGSKILHSLDITSEENKFWRMLYADNTGMDIRRKYFLNEPYYIEKCIERVMLFDYIKPERWHEAKEALNASTIYVENSDIFNMYLPDNAFDVIYLSNLHNFYTPNDYVSKIRKMRSHLRDKGRIILYCIGMKENWFYAWDRRILPNISADDFNPDYRELFDEVMRQLIETMIMYSMLKEEFSVLIIPLKTGGGYMHYNTPTDCVLVIQ